MKRLLICASPVIGVVLGMLAILLFRQQQRAEAVVPPPVQMVQQAEQPTQSQFQEFRWPNLRQSLAPRYEDQQQPSAQEVSGEQVVRRTRE